METYINARAATRWCLVAVTIAVLLTVAGPARPSLGSTTFPTAQLADVAVSRNGQYGGSCYVFVHDVLLQVSSGADDIGGADSYGYQATYQRAGGQPIPLSNAQRGAIIQLSPYPNSWYGNGHQHTAIVVDPPSSGPNWMVVDSNWGTNNIVSVHRGSDVINWAHSYGLMIDVWQFGTPTPSVPPAPSAVATPYGEDVFWTGFDQKLYEESFNYHRGTWVGPAAVPNTGGVASSPSAVFNTYGEDIYYTGTDGYVHEVSWNSNGWSGPAQIPGISGLTTAPSAVYNGHGQDIFIRGNNGVLYEESWNYRRGTWVGAAAVPNTGGVASSPSAVFNTYGEDIYYWGPSVHVDEVSWNSNGWSGPAQIV